MKVTVNNTTIKGVDRIDIGVLPGVAEHLNKMLGKIKSSSTDIESGNAALEIAIWVRDNISFTADRHPNS